MAKNALYNKVTEAHTVGFLPTGQRQIYVGRTVIHEVTSPQAFDMLRERGIAVVRNADRIYAVVDHVIPTGDRSRPFKNKKAEVKGNIMKILDKITLKPLQVSFNVQIPIVSSSLIS